MTKLEEVARALYRQHAASLGPLECGEDRGWCLYEADARAAIEAMREPSEAMTEAGLKGAIAGVGGCWRAMIDAALEEKPA